MLRTCLERVLLTVLLTAFSIIFSSSLRSVHWLWSHVHGSWSGNQDAHKTDQKRVASLERVDVKPHNCCWMSWYWCCYCTDHGPQDPRTMKTSIYISHLIPRMEKTLYKLYSISLSLPVPNGEVNSNSKFNTKIHTTMLRTCLERVLLTVLLTAFSIIFSSSLRSVHWLWSHVHGSWSGNQDAHKTDQKRVASLERVDVKPHNCCWMSWYWCCYCTDHGPQDPRTMKTSIYISHLIPRMEKTLYKLYSISLSLPVPNGEVNSNSKFNTKIHTTMLRTCLERVLLTVLLTAFSIIFSSSLRSVHWLWSHVHGSWSGNQDAHKTDQKRVASLERVDVKPHNCCWMSWYWCCYCTDHGPQDPRTMKTSIYISHLIPRMEKTLYKLYSISLSLPVPNGEVNSNSKFNTKIHTTMLRTCLERVLLTVLLTAFSIIFSSSLRSVHWLWSHVHGSWSGNQDAHKTDQKRVASLERVDVKPHLTTAANVLVLVLLLYAPWASRSQNNEDQ